MLAAAAWLLQHAQVQPPEHDNYHTRQHHVVTYVYTLGFLSADQS